MTANSDDPYIERSLREVETALLISKSRLARSLSEVFQEADTRLDACLKLLEEKGLARTIDVLNDRRGWAERMYYFGPYRIFTGKRQILAGLRELPDAMTTHHELMMQKRDLTRARESLQRGPTHDRNGEDERRNRSPRKSDRDRDR